MEEKKKEQETTADKQEKRDESVKNSDRQFWITIFT